MLGKVPTSILARCRQEFKAGHIPWPEYLRRSVRRGYEALVLEGKCSIVKCVSMALSLPTNSRASSVPS